MYIIKYRSHRARDPVGTVYWIVNKVVRFRNLDDAVNFVFAD